MDTQLTTQTTTRLQLLDFAMMSWAEATTDATSPRYADIIHDKLRYLGAFWDWAGKMPGEVSEADVKGWQQELEARKLAPSTIYAYISRISSFYRWAMKDPQLGHSISHNPVTLARPKAPKAYANESARALSPQEAQDLVAAVREKAETGSVVGKRDYSLLLFYLLSGLRRNEVVRLTWGDVRLNGTMVIRTRVKGGEYTTREVEHPLVKAALVDYLEASGRWGKLKNGDPIYTRHDRAGKPGGQLTSHAVAKNFKGYAAAAGIQDFHLHMLRHTYGTLVYSNTGSIVETQDAMGHSNPATTKGYIHQVATKKDKHSQAIGNMLGL